MKYIVDKPTSRTALKTFYKIVDAAEDLIYERGYFNCTINDIAKRAGIAVGTLYLYFDSKYTVYVYIMQRYEEQLKATLDFAVRNCKNRLDIEVEGVKAFIMQAIDNPKCYNLIWESLYVNKDLFFNYYNNFAKSYVYALKKARDQLEDDIDLETLSYCLMGISNFVGLQAISDNDVNQEKIDEMMKTVRKLLQDGVFKKK